MNELIANNITELSHCLSQAQAGTVIVIGDGSYVDTGVLEIGTAEKPIVLRADRCHGARFSGRAGIRIRGNHVIVCGLEIVDYHSELGCAIEVSGRYARITECVIADSRTDGIVVKETGVHARIDNSLVRNVDLFVIQVQVLRDAVPDRCRIDHSLFLDQRNGEGANGREVVQVGQNYMSAGNARAYAVIEYHKVFRCAGDQSEILSIKTSNNTIRNMFVVARNVPTPE